jgi:hypothetical protein
VMRNGFALCIEGRKSLVESDTIPLKLWQLTQKNYFLKIAFTNFTEQVEAYLQDKYLQLTTPLNVTGQTKIAISINTDAASYAPDRFKIVMGTYTTLPLHLLGIKAVEKYNGVEVGWTAESESNMDRYEIEKSIDGVQFAKVGTVKAKANPGLSSLYSWFDLMPVAGDNFYRIKSYDKAGESKYSGVVKAKITKGISAITVFPNPILGTTMALAFNNIKKGNYAVTMVNSAGVRVYEGVINHNAGSSNYKFELSKTLPPGVYQLLISNNQDTEKIKVLVQ